MTATLTDEPTLTEVLTVLDDDVIPLLDSASGALYTRRDGLDHDADEAESLAVAADLLAQAWANARRAVQIVRDDVPAGVADDTPASRWTVKRECLMGPDSAWPWVTRRPDGAIHALAETHAHALVAVGTTAPRS